VTTRYSKEKTAHRGKLLDCSFLKIRDETFEELSLHDENILIKRRTILSRLQRKSLFAAGRGVRSPMERVEPVLLKFALWKQEAGKPITSGEGIELATSLINNTPVETEVQAFQKSRHGKDTWCLTNSYWRGFIRRHALCSW
jgi:hypothetical protein